MSSAGPVAPPGGAASADAAAGSAAAAGTAAAAEAAPLGPGAFAKDPVGVLKSLAARASEGGGEPLATLKSLAARASGGEGDPVAALKSLAAGASGEGPDLGERPEIYVGAAFAGGLVLAGLLRWLASRG
jgi:hypothetical protein